MPASKLAAATRAFVSVLLALARAYDLPLQTQGHHALSESTGGRQELRRKVPQNVQAGRRSWRRWSRHLSA